MSFSGSLLDLSVADVLEFLSISQRSGVVRFQNSDGSEVSFVLSGGKLLSGTSSDRRQSLGNVLRERYDISDDRIEQALEQQRQTEERKPLGSLLVEAGIVTLDQVEEAMVGLIESLVMDLVGWAEGSFEFEPNEVIHVDNVAHFPALLRQGAEMDVRNVLMEAVRLFDETQRAREDDLRSKMQLGSDARVEARASDSAQDTKGDEDDADLESALFKTKNKVRRLRDRAVVTITDDSALRATVSRHCVTCGWDSFHVSVVQDARTILSRLTDVDAELAVIADLAVGTFGNFAELGNMPGGRRLREEFPHVPLLMVGDDISSTARLMALRLGAQLVLDKPRRADEPATYNARFESFRKQLQAGLEGAFLSASQAYIATRSINDELRSLRDRVLELRNRSAQSTVSLSLLHHVAETTERAVLLLHRRRELLGIGAFGLGRGGKSVSELVVGSRFSLDNFPAIASCVEQGAPFQGDLSQEPGFDRLFAKIGRPITGQGLILPIKALDRVVAVVYGDNGSDRRPLITTHGLEILTTQTGLMLENLLLKRGVDSKSPAPEDTKTDGSTSEPDIDAAGP